MYSSPLCDSPLLKMRKQRHRKYKDYAPGHSTGKRRINVTLRPLCFYTEPNWSLEQHWWEELSRKMADVNPSINCGRK